MEDTFEQKIAKKKQRQMAVKYYLPIGMGLCLLLTLVQVVVQLTPLSRLNKATGIVTGLTTKISSRTSHRWGKSTPNYSLFVTVNDTSTFSIGEVPYLQLLAGDLKLKDSIVIYYPNNLLINLQSFLSEDEICQVDRKSEVLFSWEEKKARDRDVIYFLVAIIVGCYIARRYYMAIDK